MFAKMTILVAAFITAAYGAPTPAKSTRVTTIVGSIAAGDKTIAVEDVTGVSIGDKMKIGDGDTEETAVVVAVDFGIPGSGSGSGSSGSASGAALEIADATNGIRKRRAHSRLPKSPVARHLIGGGDGGDRMQRSRVRRAVRGTVTLENALQFSHAAGATLTFTPINTAAPSTANTSTAPPEHMAGRKGGHMNMVAMVAILVFLVVFILYDRLTFGFAPFDRTREEDARAVVVVSGRTFPRVISDFAESTTF